MEFQISRPRRCHQTGPAVLDDAVAFLDVVIMPADRFLRFALAVFGISECIGCAFGQFPGRAVTVVVNPRNHKPTEDQQARNPEAVPEILVVECVVESGLFALRKKPAHVEVVRVEIVHNSLPRRDAGMPVAAGRSQR